jgi:hypothetical protein
MTSTTAKNISMRVLYFTAIAGALWLWSLGPIYGIWILGVLLSAGAFFACRRQGWLLLFVVPLSVFVFLFGFEDGSFKLHGISELYKNQTVFFHLVAALLVVWAGSLFGAVKWWASKRKSQA